ncbi:hypothetical protein RRG08_005866 [Elysia crispata]|uniref:Uncharacterized protein n=1 Tax=Elysia crispata TaxID=231223 RepID=A0AAE1CZJ4_9GAST|nr:hypothetical protein RRG08_005866 [Elysia crispata]
MRRRNCGNDPYLRRCQSSFKVTQAQFYNLDLEAFALIQDLRLFIYKLLRLQLAKSLRACLSHPVLMVTREHPAASTESKLDL